MKKIILGIFLILISAGAEAVVTPTEQLFKSVQNKDILPDEIHSLLESGAIVNYRSEGRNTPLHFLAAVGGGLAAIQALVEGGAHPYLENEKGITAFDVVFFQRDTAKENSEKKRWDEILFILIKSRNTIPMHLRVKYLSRVVRLGYGGVKVLKALIDTGVDIDAVGEKGLTPLLIAIQEQNEEFVRALLEGGADPNHLNLDSSNLIGMPPLHYALTEYSSASIIKLLLEKGADPNLSVKGEESGQITLLLIALRLHAPLEIIELLVDHGADLNFENESGQRLIHEIIYMGMEEVQDPLPKKFKETQEPSFARRIEYVQKVLPFLVQKGMEIKSASFRRVNPLLYALSQQHVSPQMIRILIEAGAEPNEMRFPPLFYAVIDDQKAEVIRILLEEGANPNRLVGPNSILYMAILRKSPASVIQALLEGGADPKVMIKGDPFLEIDETSLSPEEWQLLLSFKDVERPILHDAVIQASLEVIQLLLSYGADVNQANSFGETALSMAVSLSFDPKVIQEREAEVGIESDTERSTEQRAALPLSVALKVIQLLLQSRAEADFVDENGSFLLLRVILFQAPYKVFKILLKHTSDSFLNQHGQALLSVAQKTNSPWRVRRLILSRVRPSWVRQAVNSCRVQFQSLTSSF